MDDNGIRTTIEYTINDEGKKVKVSTWTSGIRLALKIRCSSSLQITRRTKRVLQKAVVDHSVAERKTWSKFGQEKGKKPGPDRATTTVGENVSLKLSAGNKVRATSVCPSLHFPEMPSSLSGCCTRAECRADREGKPGEGWCRQGRLSSVQGRPLHRKMSIQRFVEWSGWCRCVTLMFRGNLRR